MKEEKVFCQNCIFKAAIYNDKCPNKLDRDALGYNEPGFYGELKACIWFLPNTWYRIKKALGWV